nr:MAG TPA: hypothetical protein [Caudoviricetes sp.]
MTKVTIQHIEKISQVFNLAYFFKKILPKFTKIL